jgi:hypothetical protein
MQIIKNAIENILWVAMFIPLWPIDSHNKARLSLSLLFAVLLAIIQTWKVV